MSEAQVRALTYDDYDAWSALWREYLAFYETTLGDTMFRTAFLRMTSGDPHEFQGLVAVKDGKLVGVTHFLMHRHGWREDNVCYLQDLYAAPEVRGQGIGRLLVEAVYAAADAAGAPSVYWLTQQSNSVARQLYDRIGVQTDFIKYMRKAA
ncbi:MAG: GNAT family N-acetyltransferase [Pseudomonadota bacterium]